MTMHQCVCADIAGLLYVNLSMTVHKVPALIGACSFTTTHAVCTLESVLATNIRAQPKQMGNNLGG